MQANANPCACTGKKLLVRRKTLRSQLLVTRSGTAVIGVGIDGDAAAGRKKARHLDVFGIHQGDEVLHDHIDAILVESPAVAETAQIESVLHISLNCKNE